MSGDNAVEERLIVENLREIKPRKVLMVVLDNEDAIINWVDVFGLADLFGFDKSQKNFRNLLFSQNVLSEENQRLLWENFEKPEKEYDIDLAINDDWRHFHFSFPSYDGGKVFLVKEETDLTFLKRQLEAEGEKLEKERQHYIKDLDFLADQMRNPLTTAGGHALRLLRTLNDQETTPREEIIKSLEIIASSIRRVEEMITSILEAERIAHGRANLRKEEKDMYEDVIREVLEYFEIAALLSRKRIVVDHKKSMKRGNAILFIDTRMCKILWRNLIENALKFMPEEGRLSYGVVDRGEMLEFNLYNEGDVIPEENIEKIFEKSSGLGLFLAKLIVETHGGIIEVQRKREDGVNIIFRLPKK